MKNITINRAFLHNLKEIDIVIPKNKLVVVTGVSGSGKSSLVFDIIFEEGRKQYLQSLGILSRLNEANKFDTISGIAPTIAVQQNMIRQSNPRSTVGSRTQILPMLGILYAGIGQIFCAMCDIPVDEHLTCPTCGRNEERIDATYFSYNAPNGMCMTCSGQGAYFQIHLDQLVPNTDTTVQQIFAALGTSPGYLRLLHRHFADYLEVPFAQLPDDVKEDILYGHYVESNQAQQSISLARIFNGRIQKYGQDFTGVYTLSECAECHGFRIGAEAQHVRLNGKHIGQLGKMTMTELHSFLELLRQNDASPFAQNLLDKILRKTQRLIHSRLGHLSLYREIPTLSGGEIQRLFLNNHLDSQMDSLIYILDEPTVGLHEAEKAELLTSIQALQELGNSVIVVEHDRQTIALAEHIIDIGPKAGIEGGQVVYQGNFSELLNNPESITGQYLAGKIGMPTRQSLAIVPSLPHLTVHQAQTNNLKNVTASFPLGRLVGIAGVSGSGKSSLIADTLVPRLKTCFQNGRISSQETNPLITSVTDKLAGVEHLSGFAEVSQAPIGRNLNSTPASYIGIWDKIRKLFADQPEAIQQQLTAGHFSFNAKGACTVCGGNGRETIRLSGNLEFYKTCPECAGKRFNATTLAIGYRDKTIFDVLDMNMTEALAFFADQPAILSTLQVMERIGMGYIKLGQPTPTLSGGEAQRIKLAKEIGRRRKGNILYILDEPTTGLSLYDTAKLIQLLDELVSKGNSVIVIEHDPEVLSRCDWIVELGPGSGTQGGEIICTGTPQMLHGNPNSVTGKFLRA